MGNLTDFEEFVNVDNVYIMDFKIKDLFVDVDGPSHYFYDYKILGHVHYKYSLLAKNEHKVVNIPYFYWNTFRD